MGRRMKKYIALVLSCVLLSLLFIPLKTVKAESEAINIIHQILKNLKIVDEFSVQVDSTIYLPKQLLSYQIEILKTEERSSVTKQDFWELKGTEEGWILNNLPWIYLPPDFSLVQHAFPSKKISDLSEPLARIEEWYQLGQVMDRSEGEKEFAVLQLHNPFQKLELLVDLEKKIITRITISNMADKEIAVINYQGWLDMGQAYLPSRIVVERHGKKLMMAEFKDWDLNPGSGVTVVIDEDGRIQELLELSKENPENANLHYQLAREYEKMGKIQQAVREYERAISIQEKVEYIKDLRDILYEQQRWTDALQWARKIVSLKVAGAEDYFILGQIYTRLHNPVLACDAFEKAIEDDNDYVQAWERIYWIYLNLAERDRTFLNKALNAAVRLVNLNPREYEFHNYLGDVYLQLRRKDDAFKEYQKALELSPGNGWTYLKMARYYEAIEQFQLARQLYKESIKVTGEWWSYEAYGEFLLAREEYQEAEEAYRAALSLQPERVELSIQLGKVLILKGERMEALKVWKEALKLAPADIYTYLRVGKVLQEYGFEEEAEKVFREASKLFVPDGKMDSWQNEALGEVYYYLGCFRYQQGDIEGAIKYFEQGFPHLPHPGAVFLLGRKYLVGGDAAMAVKVWEKGLQRDPNHSLTKIGLGLLALIQGNNDGALWYFRGLEENLFQDLISAWEQVSLIPEPAQDSSPLKQIIVEIREGDLAQAEEGLTAILEKDPHYLEAKLLRVILSALMNSGNSERNYQDLLSDTANSIWTEAAALFRRAAARLYRSPVEVSGHGIK